MKIIVIGGGAAGLGVAEPQRASTRQLNSLFIRSLRTWLIALVHSVRARQRN